MTIQYCSDLHLEFPANRKYIRRHPIEPVGDILLLAGDIASFRYINDFRDFFDYLSENFACTYWLPGNHEYYDYDLNLRSGSFNEAIRKNVFLVNNIAAVHGTTRFIFSTLWSAVSDKNAGHVVNSISDFKLIHVKERLLTVADFNAQHQASLSFVKTELEKSWAGKTIVATHHVPTLFHYPKRYAGSELNEVFASEQYNLIEQTKPDYWIYGHHHFNTPGFTIGHTNLLTNQLGYIHHRENISFNNTAHILIEP